MEKRDLIDFFRKSNVIMTGEFVGKSGEKYNIETDVRNAYLDFSSSIKASEIIYKYISSVYDFDIPFIGVPETGTLITFFLNMAYYKHKKHSFSYNIVRSVPKEYQITTNSVYTVLPVNPDQEYVLIEDDVVTGKTVCKYLDSIHKTGIKIRAVISIFGRNSAIDVSKTCECLGIPYYELINVKEIEEEIL